MLKPILTYSVVFLLGLSFPSWLRYILLIASKSKKDKLPVIEESKNKEATHETLNEKELSKLKQIKLAGRNGKQTDFYENDLVHVSYSDIDFPVPSKYDYDPIDLAKIINSGKINIYSKLNGEFVKEIKGGFITTRKAESLNGGYKYCLPDGEVFFDGHYFEKKLVPKK